MSHGRHPRGAGCNCCPDLPEGPAFLPLAPPPVCTGTGTVPADFMPMATSVPTHGLCGICGQRVPLIYTGQASVLATHAYVPVGGQASEPGGPAEGT